MRNFITLILVLCFNATLSFAQVSKSDFELLNNTSRTISGSSLDYQFDIARAYSNLEEENQVVSLPNINGGFDEYEITPSNVIAESVKHFYTVKTFRGYKRSDRKVMIALETTPSDFKATVIDNHDSFVIEKTESAEARVESGAVKVRAFEVETEGATCGSNHTEDDLSSEIRNLRSTVSRVSNTKRVYKAAIAATGNYSEQFGGTPFSKTNVLNSIASGVNIANLIFVRDLGIELELVTTPDIIFEDKTTDPYRAKNDQTTVLRGNDTVLDEAIGADNYDIGHVVSWQTAGGVAYVGNVCTSVKGAAFSSTMTNFETLWTFFFCHETGHQLGAHHNFSAVECSNSKDGKRFEPGAGSSIMSYYNLCASSSRYTNTLDASYHPFNIEAIKAVQEIRTCGEDIYVDNEAPVSEAGNQITIPKGTPFVLVGAAIDENNDDLTYQWSQYDGESNATVGSPDCTDPLAALFRYRQPSQNPYREFPVHQDLLNNNTTALQWEALPCVSRALNFAFVTRDNNEELGRTSTEKIRVAVAETGPFEITSFGESEFFYRTQGYNVNWSVNGTDTHSPYVDILISFDNGVTYQLLESKVANNGSYNVNIDNPEQMLNAILAIRGHVQTVENNLYVPNGSDELRTSSTFYNVLPITLSISEVSLPVEFDSFEGELVDGQIELEWTTIVEANNEGFNVQKLHDSSWETIGYVQGNGTTNTLNNYSFNDSNVESTNVYRLEQVDFDGKVSYSEVVTVENLDQINELIVYKNDQNNSIEILNVDREIEVRVFDINGREMTSKTLNSNASINVANYPHGIYILNYEMDDKRHSVKVML